MTITALLVLNSNIVDNEEPKVLAVASDVSHFSYFKRASAKEFILFVARIVANRTPPGQRHSVQQEDYMVHAFNRNGLCGVVLADTQYPMRSAFSVLIKVLDEYQRNFGDSWQSIKTDKLDVWPFLNDALARYQDPTEADKILKIQKELDETKHILHEALEALMDRGEKLDTLMEKSADLGLASQGFYKQAKKTKCCTIL
ncbi:hypothetical protein KP509_36G055700 [Ceratopteris richardii]|uniref:Uncharacterized protein n=1 Tax=Ceratopteris richardii TaxID=49495 RepID=A0A8T2QD51_CERRI|nr:hypothetical protein KP509_36G055700 [Ceratopteris richardii]